jgi:hypothetical protein
MTIGFFFVGKVQSKTGSAHARILSVLFKDEEDFWQQLNVRFYENSERIAQPEHCYLFTGTAILQEGMPPKLHASNLFGLALEEQMLPANNLQMQSTVVITKPATNPDHDGRCFFDASLTEYDSDPNVARNVTVSINQFVIFYFIFS